MTPATGPARRASAALELGDVVELKLEVLMPGAEVTLAIATLELAALETMDAGAVKMLVGMFASSMFVGETTIPPVMVAAEVVEDAGLYEATRVESESESVEGASEGGSGTAATLLPAPGWWRRVLGVCSPLLYEWCRAKRVF